MGNKSIGKSSRRDAKARREEKVITQDERMEQALVPEDEQPYAVPENWVWVRFFTTVDYEQPANYIVESTEYQDNFDTPVLTAGKSFILGYTDEDFGIFRNLPVIIFDDFTTELKYVDFPFKVKSSAMKILHSTTDTSIEFIYYYMQTVDCDHSNHKRFWISTYSKLPFPIPPLAEQRRIVERIESLFEKLDRARELAQNALDSFETRKAAILHKAFTGELTRKWREENGVGMESWEEKRLDDCGQWFGGGTPNTNISDYWDDGTILWVTPKDMKAITIIDTIDKITQKAVNESSANLLKKSAVLFVMRSGILQRVLPIAMTTQQVTVNQDMKAVIPHNDILLEYLCWFCISREKDIREKCSKNGTTVESINTEMLYAYTVNIPTVTEQQEIVRIFDSLLEKDQHVRTLCGIIEKIDLMKKAILARAFRGELGTNDSGEESAMELGGGNDQFQRNIR